jgi:hypothetical protein
VTSQINVQFTLFVYSMSWSKVTRLYSAKNNWFIICDKKNLPWFVIWYDFSPTRFVFSIPSPRLRDRKHKTCWIKIIANHKPWEILYIHINIYNTVSMSLWIIVSKLLPQNYSLSAESKQNWWMLSIIQIYTDSNHHKTCELCTNQPIKQLYNPLSTSMKMHRCCLTCINDWLSQSHLIAFSIYSQSRSPSAIK